MSEQKAKMFLGDKEIIGSGSYSFSTEKYIFKRYMFFKWDEFDNTDPFNCIVDSFDDLKEAIALFEQHDAYGKCIFDRIEGCMVLEEPEMMY